MKFVKSCEKDKKSDENIIIKFKNVKRKINNML